MQEIGGCVTTTAIPVEDIIKNIQENRKRDLQNVYDTPWWREHEHIAIVGGGPSLKDEVHKLKNYKYIMACGSVHDYLWEQGILPTWCVLIDPDPLMVNYLKHVDGWTTYLVGSQCAKEVFEHLKDFNVYIWHADGDRIENKAEVFGEEYRLVGGGCTVGTRAMILALGMGFRQQDLFGMDTCLTNTYKHHAYEFDNPDVETVGNIIELKLGGPESPTFKVAEYMLAQLFDFKAILKVFAHQLQITVYGDGMLKYLMEQGEKKAKEVISNGSGN